MNPELEQSIYKLPEYKQKIRGITETITANVVMISEIPAPTFGEMERMNFLINRFTEQGLHNCSTDEAGNAVGILPGRTGEKRIIVVAHLDTLFDESVDHTVTLLPDRIIGPGVGDNGLGLGVISMLPTILDHLGIQLDSDLLLMGSAQSLGRGNIEGIRFFLDHTDLHIHAGLCVEGVELGRISYSSIGMMRCEIEITIPEEYDWSRFGASGAIINMNRVINRILSLPIPRQPQTSILIGSVEGGTSFNTIATSSHIRLEVRSESEEMVSRLSDQIRDITDEITALTNSDVKLDILAWRKPGGIEYAHPLVEHTRKSLGTLGVKHRILPSTSELSAFIARKIPALTIGITTGENMDKPNETVRTEPIPTGIAQLVGLLEAIDQGCCGETE